jgi:hypothetical protein
LAPAFLFTGNRDFCPKSFTQLETWFEQNPFQRGINWASALEVAFRALSWIWLYHLIGSEMSGPFRKKFLTGLYQHGRHLTENLSVYFSPNTHLLGEAVALYALSTLFPDFQVRLTGVSAAAILSLHNLIFRCRLTVRILSNPVTITSTPLISLFFFISVAGRPSLVEADFKADGGIPLLAARSQSLHQLLGR